MTAASSMVGEDCYHRPKIFVREQALTTGVTCLSFSAFGIRFKQLMGNVGLHFSRAFEIIHCLGLASDQMCTIIFKCSR